QLSQVVHVFSSARVFNHRDGSGAPSRWIDRLAHLSVRFFNERRKLADSGLHRSPSSPLISEALSPPTRAWIRGPVVITSASRISSARGASATPTSIASK